MIRIIKPGMQEFYAFCTHCGCEFTYELSDLNLCGTCKCPTCKKDYYHQSRTCPSTRAAEQYGGNGLVVNGPHISLQDLAIPCVECLDTSLTGKKSCNCDENAVCSTCSCQSGAITALNDGINGEDATDSSIHCLCQGDIWKTTKCECSVDLDNCGCGGNCGGNCDGNCGCSCDSSSQTTAYAAITKLDTKVEEATE